MVSLKQKILIVLSSFFIIMCDEGSNLNMESDGSGKISIPNAQNEGKSNRPIYEPEAAADEELIQLPIEVVEAESESFNLAGLQNYSIQIIGKDGADCNKYRCSSPFTPSSNYLSKFIIVEKIQVETLVIDGKVYQPEDDDKLNVAGDCTPSGDSSNKITLAKLGDPEDKIDLIVSQCLEADKALADQSQRSISFTSIKTGEGLPSSDQSQAVTDALTVDVGSVTFTGSANVEKLEAHFIADLTGRGDETGTTEEDDINLWLITGAACYDDQEENTYKSRGELAEEIWDDYQEDAGSDAERVSLFNFISNTIYSILDEDEKAILVEIDGLHFSTAADQSHAGNEPETVTVTCDHSTQSITIRGAQTTE